MHFLLERIQKTCDELKALSYSDRVIITDYQFLEGHYLGIEGLPEQPLWQPFTTGDFWGARDYNCWFRTTVTVPNHFSGKTVALYFKTFDDGWDAINPQFILYVNGEQYHGLDMNHREAIITDNAVAGTEYTIDLHAYAGMSGLSQDYRSTLSGQLVVVDEVVRHLYYDLQVPLWVCEKLDEQDIRRIDMINVLNEAINLLDLRQPGSILFYQSVNAAQTYMDSEFYDALCGNETISATIVGHTHIDVAWHWTVAQTRQKVGRSFATVLQLMKQYPEYRFLSSQSQLYQFVKEDYPELYAQIKQAISDGVWEAEGAMWLEADCNVTSGESLVRQILYGKKFFREEFGVDNHLLWLPDVFGYSAALPQILQKSEIPYFMTTKISWNQFNKIPYDTFMWKGIDGSEVLTHFITTTEPYQDEQKQFTTYNGQLHPGAVIGAWRRYQQKELSKDVLIAYGFGDGGGGATYEMLETSRRMEKGIPSCPVVKQGKALTFFEALDKKVKDHKRLPKWSGELYLEFHRGTYTSMARNKRDNRKSELLYQELEKWQSIASQFNFTYNKAEIDRQWRTILLNQFHDILPGTSIKEVYDVTAREYEHILVTGVELKQAAMIHIQQQIQTDAPGFIVYNSLSHQVSAIATITIPDGMKVSTLIDAAGTVVPIQMISATEAIFYANNVPSCGYKVFYPSDKTPAASTLVVSSTTMSNQFVALTFDETGLITSFYDRIAGREVLQANKKGNMLQAFEDKPMEYDNWDIDMYYSEKMWLVDDVQSISVIERGPVRATLEIKRLFLDSTITQQIHMYHDLARIDFETDIDWRQSQVLLKAAFPADINSDKASYEIQYGSVERPTHINTSWDSARFEVCAHKWADLSEAGYGLSLLNDAKYGHDIIDGMMRLTLLKSGIEPNPTTDQEHHHFTYSLYAHRDTWREAGTELQAAILNTKLTSNYLHEAQAGLLPSHEHTFFSIDADNIHIEAIKAAEDGRGTIIRMYESQNKRTACVLQSGQVIDDACETNLIENDAAALEYSSHAIPLVFSPFEIKTIRINATMDR